MCVFRCGNVLQLQTCTASGYALPVLLPHQLQTLHRLELLFFLIYIFILLKGKVLPALEVPHANKTRCFMEPPNFQGGLFFVLFCFWFDFLFELMNYQNMS